MPRPSTVGDGQRACQRFESPGTTPGIPDAFAKTMDCSHSMKIANPDLTTPLIAHDDRPLVVLVDDDQEFLDWAAIQLRNSGYAVGLGNSGLEVLNYMTKSVLHPKRFARPALLISDLYMPGLTGLQLAEDLARARCLPRWTLMTAFADTEILDSAARLGALAVLQKPFDSEALTATVKMALS